MPHRLLIAQHKILAEAPAGKEGHVVWHGKDGNRLVARHSELPILASLAGLTSMLFGVILGVFGWFAGFAVLGGVGLVLLVATSLLHVSRWRLLCVVESGRPSGAGEMRPAGEAAVPAARPTLGAEAGLERAPKSTSPKSSSTKSSSLTGNSLIRQARRRRWVTAELPGARGS